MNNNRNNPAALGNESIVRLLVQYSIPAIIAMTATSLYNIVDSIFIGRGVGALAIAGLAITFPLMNLVVAFQTLIAAGGATVCSIFMGQKEDGLATETLYNVTVLSIIHGFLFGGLALIFLEPLLVFFGATEHTISYASEFMRVILIGTPVTYVFFGLNNLIRASGYPKKAMFSALFSVIINVILAPIFIFTLDRGIQGAAEATVISQTLSLIWVVSHFISKKSYIRFKSGYNRFNYRIIKLMYGIGLSPFFMNACSCIVVILINKSLLDYGNDLGDLGVGSFGIINRVAMVFVLTVFGITQGMQPILGYNYGAGNWDRVKKTLKYGLFLAVSINIVGWILCEIFPRAISELFTVDSTLIDLTSRGFRLSFLAWPFVGAQIIIQNFFQSIGNPRVSIFLSLTRQMLFLVPLLIILPYLLGTDGVWISLSLSDFIASVLAIITLIIQVKKLNKIYAEKL